MVDDADYSRVSALRWFAQRVNHNWYASCDLRKQGGKYLLMHRFIIGAPPGKEVDHRSGYGLNNQRRNLRICTVQQNRFAFKRKAKNKTSAFRGVSWHSQIGKWRATIKKDGIQFSLGCFVDEVAAAQAFDLAAVRLFGDFHHLNFKRKGAVCGKPRLL